MSWTPRESAKPSWSLSCIGKADNVVAEIERYSASLNGQSKIEFDDAKPAMITLVRQNFVAPSATGYREPLIDLEASGSGSAQGQGDDAVQLQRNCSVVVKPLWRNLV